MRSHSSSGSRRDEGAAAAVDEQRRLAAEQDDIRAGDPAARAPARFGQGSAAPYGWAGSAAASTSARLLRGLVAQPLDRAGERELRAAEALDEVAAAAGSEHLEAPELAVDGA